MHIRIITPSGAIDPCLIEGARKRLESWGYQVSEGRYARARKGRFCGTIEERLSDIHEALNDTSVDAVLCARGGYGIVQLLDQINIPQDLRTGARRQLLIGFSDITALHNLYGLYGIVSLHGVMCKHIAEYETHREAVDAWREALNKWQVASGKLQVINLQPATYNLQPATCNLNRAGKARGVLRGGNLSVFYGLQGTPYAIRTDEPTILFIEDVGEKPYAIDRMMNNLRLSGVLSRIKGLIVGQFSDYEEDALMLGTVYDRIRAAVEPYDYPVLFDYPAGHVERNLPLFLNAEYELEV